MTISTQDQITRELARLRIWRHVSGDESLKATVEAHQRINALLSLLYPEKESSRHSHVSTAVAPKQRGHPARL